MKRRIAVCANGWGNEYLHDVVTGAFTVAKEADVDIFAFVDYTGTGDTLQRNIAEMNIFTLPDFKDFDGVMILGNSLNIKEEVEFVYKSAKDSKLPAVSVGYDMEGFDSVMTDNYSGMYELMEHLICDHGVRRIAFISGPLEHYDCIIRLRAVKAAMAKHGLEFSDDNVIQSDWARNPFIVEKWLNKHGVMPDAFVCANDFMAAGVCDYLKENNYRIPDDVIVTGYDYIGIGKMNLPAITTVSLEWENMGIKAMEILLNRMNGQEVTDITPVKTILIKSESCGCEEEYYINRRNRERERLHYADNLDSWECDTHYRELYTSVRKSANAQSLYESLHSVYSQRHFMEGDNFMICLEEEFFNVEEGNENLRTVGYSDEIDVIYSMKDGKSRVRQILPTREVMFRASEEIKEPKIYIFFSLFSEGKSFGFAMLERDMDIILGFRGFTWTRHIIQYLEQVRQNITIDNLMKRLKNLSVTDVLTGVYNRAGCERIAYPMLSELKKEGKISVVMMADVDRMKVINDEFGHECGDMALCTVAKILKSQVPSNWIVSRFGGDEFFIGGEIDDSVDIEQIIEAINCKLKNEVKRRRFRFDLTVSIGYEKIKPDRDFNVEKSLKKADNLMYVVKSHHHEEADRR